MSASIVIDVCYVKLGLSSLLCCLCRIMDYTCWCRCCIGVWFVVGVIFGIFWLFLVESCL